MCQSCSRFLAAIIAAFALGHTRAANAQEQAEGTRSETTDDSEIVVTGEQTDDTRIDRRVYTIRDDPEAQTAPIVDVLSRLPSVTVSPTGQIRLLGHPGVLILIDGRRPTNAEVALRTLLGSAVERIEIITNPSAQFGPEGSAGVINIITRRRFAHGVSGSALANVDTRGGLQASVSPSLSDGAWDIGGSLSVARSVTEVDIARTRQPLDALDGPALREASHSTSDTGSISATFQVTHRPDNERRISASAEAHYAGGDGNRVIDVTSDDPAFEPFREFVSGPGTLQAQALTLRYEWNGTEGRELTLTGSVQGYGGDNQNLISHTSNTGDFAYRSILTTDQTAASAQLDYDQPLGESRLLALGSQFDWTDRTIDDVLQHVSGSAALGPDLQSTVSGEWNTLAVYGTLQFSLGDWRILPGLRLEDRRRIVTSAGVGGEDRSTDIYPSLHLERHFTDDLELRASYSKRVDHPDLGSLNPAIRYVDTTRATVGNPSLEPVTTHAYEASIDYTPGNSRIGLTIYDRRSVDVWSSFTETNTDGVDVTTTVNAGTRLSRGAELSVRGQMSPKWRYSLVANMFYRELDVLDGSLIRRDDQFRYTINGQLEFRDGELTEGGSNQVQLNVRYQSEEFGFQTTESDFVTADLIWRRSLTSRASLVLSLYDLFDSSDTDATLVTNDFVQRSHTFGAGLRARLALSYRLGPDPGQ
ncbi:MAG: TonB-dependent receptor [Hyphomonadaceae bacterium]